MTAIEDYKLANKNITRFNKHLKRGNNDLVAAMYAMYCTGKSMRYIAKEYNRTHQSIYHVFNSRHYPLRSKQLKGLLVLDNIKFTETKGGYLRGTFNGRRLSMQRYVWEKHFGPVPSDSCVYHKDHDRKNNTIENLELIKISDMSGKFNPKGRNQYSFGRPGYGKTQRELRREKVARRWAKINAL